jgi:hypothetical protein
MLVSRLRDSQRAVVEKQLRRNLSGMKSFSAETLLEDTDCELVEGADAAAWWDDMQAKKQRTSGWLETVQKFADEEAERAGGVDFSIKVNRQVDIAPLTDMLTISEEESDSVESEDESDEEEESEEEEEESEEDVAADAREEAKELGIKRKRLEAQQADTDET